MHSHLVNLAVYPLMKEQIIAGARQLFNHYGVKTVRLDDVTHQLGITKKTLYQYFDNKEDLVRQMLDAQLGESLHEAQSKDQKEDHALGEIDAVLVEGLPLALIPSPALDPIPSLMEE